ncbi:hypothetical protein ACQKNX_23155 [Lysinibacillus sp. NPDC093712]|uniref:hypothetical protein n=1 Tax=Lysinibacillus sp. NPDC093712 TaxID=3390579 RepID=UPI003CFF628D
MYYRFFRLAIHLLLSILSNSSYSPSGQTNGQKAEVLKFPWYNYLLTNRKRVANS